MIQSFKNFNRHKVKKLPKYIFTIQYDYKALEATKLSQIVKILDIIFIFTS